MPRSDSIWYASASVYLVPKPLGASRISRTSRAPGSRVGQTQAPGQILVENRYGHVGSFGPWGMLFISLTISAIAALTLLPDGSLSRTIWSTCGSPPGSCP